MKYSIRWHRCEVDSALFRIFLMGVLGDFEVEALDESPWPAFAKSMFVLLMSAGALEPNMERCDATLPPASSHLFMLHLHLRFSVFIFRLPPHGSTSNDFARFCSHSCAHARFGGLAPLGSLLYPNERFCFARRVVFHCSIVIMKKCENIDA